MTGRGLSESHAPVRARALILQCHGVAAKAEPYGYDLRSQVHSRGRSRGAAAGARPEATNRLRAVFRGQYQPGRGLGRRNRHRRYRGRPRPVRLLPECPRGRDARLHADCASLRGVGIRLGVPPVGRARELTCSPRTCSGSTRRPGYSDSIIDAGQGTNYGGTGLFNRSNVEETGRASVTPEAQQTAGRVPFRCQLHVRTRLVLRVRRRGELRFDLHRLQRGLRGPARLRQSRHQRPDRAATLKGFYEWQESTVRAQPAVSATSVRESTPP